MVPSLIFAEDRDNETSEATVVAKYSKKIRDRMVLE